jgi:hypothetical protein
MECASTLMTPASRNFAAFTRRPAAGAGGILIGRRLGKEGVCPDGGMGANLRNDLLLWVMYGRRPRCKRNLTISEAFGCGHVFGL